MIFQFYTVILAYSIHVLFGTVIFYQHSKEPSFVITLSRAMNHELPIKFQLNVLLTVIKDCNDCVVRCAEKRRWFIHTSRFWLLHKSRRLFKEMFSIILGLVLVSVTESSSVFDYPTILQHLEITEFPPVSTSFGKPICQPQLLRFCQVRLEIA